VIFKHAARNSAHWNGCGLSPKRLNRPVRYGDWSTCSHTHTHTHTHTKFRMPPFITNKYALLSRIYNISKLILIVVGSSSTISNKKLDYFCAVSNTVPSHNNKLFTANKLTINLDKTSIIQCRMRFFLQYAFGIGKNKKYKIETANTKFFALQIHNYIM
jgi:hypothetical protein